MGVNRTDYDRAPREMQPRELEALALLGECLPQKAIARRMRVEPGTVKVYLHNAYETLGFGLLPEASLRALAVRWSMARALGLPRSIARDPRARLLEDLGLPADWPASGRAGGGSPFRSLAAGR